MLNLDIFKTDNSSELSDFVRSVDNVNYIASNLQDKSAPKILLDSPTLISIAAFYGSQECFQMLLYCEANLKISDRQGRLPIHFACAGGSSEICDLLDSSGCDFTPTDNNKKNCLHYACEYGQLNMVQRLFFRNFELTTLSAGKLAPIHYACMSENSDIVDFLCSKGADINCVTADKQTPLLIALKRGDSETLKVLIKYGVDIKIVESDGMTPLMCACRRGNTGIVEVILENESEDPNYTDSLGWAALHFASENNNLEIVSILISHNVDVNLRTKAGMTPTHLALNRQCKEVLAFLQENGGSL